VSRGASENKSCASGAKELPQGEREKEGKKEREKEREEGREIESKRPAAGRNSRKRPKFGTLVSWSCSVSCRRPGMRWKKKKENEKMRDTEWTRKRIAVRVVARKDHVPALAEWTK